MVILTYGRCDGVIGLCFPEPDAHSIEGSPHHSNDRIEGPARATRLTPCHAFSLTAVRCRPAYKEASRCRKLCRYSPHPPSFRCRSEPAMSLASRDVIVDVQPDQFAAWTSSNETAIYCNIVLTSILVYDSSKCSSSLF